MRTLPEDRLTVAVWQMTNKPIGRQTRQKEASDVICISLTKRIKLQFTTTAVQNVTTYLRPFSLRQIQASLGTYCAKLMTTNHVCASSVFKPGPQWWMARASIAELAGLPTWLASENLNDLQSEHINFTTSLPCSMFILTLTVAALGRPQISASSPKLPPSPIVVTCSLFTNTCKYSSIAHPAYFPSHRQIVLHCTIIKLTKHILLKHCNIHWYSLQRDLQPSGFLCELICQTCQTAVLYLHVKFRKAIQKILRISFTSVLKDLYIWADIMNMKGHYILCILSWAKLCSRLAVGTTLQRIHQNIHDDEYYQIFFSLVPSCL